jgi:hypothetical protein
MTCPYVLSVRRASWPSWRATSSPSGPHAAAATRSCGAGPMAAVRPGRSPCRPDRRRRRRLSRSVFVNGSPADPGHERPQPGSRSSSATPAPAGVSCAALVRWMFIGLLRPERGDELRRLGGCLPHERGHRGAQATDSLRRTPEPRPSRSLSTRARPVWRGRWAQSSAGSRAAPLHTSLQRRVQGTSPGAPLRRRTQARCGCVAVRSFWGRRHGTRRCGGSAAR